jgi:hypothetical protein
MEWNSFAPGCLVMEEEWNQLFPRKGIYALDAEYTCSIDSVESGETRR